MKKILYSIMAIGGLFMASCAGFDDPVTENYGEGPTVTITVTETTDSAFTFTVNAPNAAYYSVLVDESTKAVAVNPESLYKGAYSSVYNKVVSASENATFTYNMRDAKGAPLCSPNTTYQIYAIAGNDKGVIGEVAVKAVVTTDQLAPRPTSYQFYDEDKAMVVSFSEALARGEGAVKVSYYAHNELMAGTINPVEVPAEEIFVEVAGGDIAIVAPTTPDGAWVTFGWEAGAFVDGAGQPCAAFASGFDTNEFDFVGLVGRNAFGSFAITDANVTAPEHGSEIENWETFMGTITLDYNVYPVSSMAENAFSVTYTGAKSVKTITLDSERWAVSGSLIYFVLPEAPAPGDIVTVSIAEGVVTDVYGNPNEAFTSTEAWWKMFDFAVTKDMVTGTFNATAFGYFENADLDLGSLTIEEDAVNEDEMPDVAMVFKNFFLNESNVPGYWNENSDKLYMATWFVLGQMTDSNGTIYNAVILSSSDPNNKDFVELTVNKDGTITTDDIGIYLFDETLSSALGWYEVFTSTTLTPVASTSATTSNLKAISSSKSGVKIAPRRVDVQKKVSLK